jgi:hypothetical protein
VTSSALKFSAINLTTADPPGHSCESLSVADKTPKGLFVSIPKKPKKGPSAAQTLDKLKKKYKT